MKATLSVVVAIRFGLFGALGVALVTVGCRRATVDTPLPTNVVARVDTQSVSVAALEQELARRRLAQPTPADRAAVLEDLIRQEVLYASARQAGFDQKPELQAAIKRLIIAEYRESLETNRPVPGQFTDAEIAAYYRQHADRYSTPEQVRTALISLPRSPKATPEKEAEMRQRAEALRAQAVAGASTEPTFGLLAQSNSAHQATRYRGGDLGWLTHDSMQREWEPALVEAVFALDKPGAITPVIAGKDGLYLFKLMERKPAALKPLAEVRDGIAYQLAREEAAQQEAQLYARLKAGIPIQINQAALTRLMTNRPSASTPPALPSQ